MIYYWVWQLGSKGDSFASEQLSRWRDYLAQSNIVNFQTLLICDEPLLKFWTRVRKKWMLRFEGNSFGSASVLQPGPMFRAGKLFRPCFRNPCPFLFDTSMEGYQALWPMRKHKDCVSSTPYDTRWEDQFLRRIDSGGIFIFKVRQQLDEAGFYKC